MMQEVNLIDSIELFCRDLIAEMDDPNISPDQAMPQDMIFGYLSTVTPKAVINLINQTSNPKVYEASYKVCVALDYILCNTTGYIQIETLIDYLMAVSPYEMLKLIEDVRNNTKETTH